MTTFMEIDESELPAGYGLEELRAAAVEAVLVTRVTIGWAFAAHKAGSSLTNLDVLGLDGVKAATVTYKARFYTGPGGRLIGLRPKTVKDRRMLAVAIHIAPSAILSLKSAR